MIVDDAGRLVTMDRRTRRGGPIHRDPDPERGVHPDTAVQPGSDPRPVEAGVADWLHGPIDWSTRDLDTGRRFFDGDLRTFVFARDGTCRMPVCTARITDGDHITARSDGGSTTATNGQGLSRRCHHLRDLAGWQLTGDADRTVWTTPTGHRYQSEAPPVLGWGSEPP